MSAVREIVGVRVVPWLWNLPPNDRRYHPVYVACVELGVPCCLQIGLDDETRGLYLPGNARRVFTLPEKAR